LNTHRSTGAASLLYSLSFPPLQFPPSVSPPPLLNAILKLPAPLAIDGRSSPGAAPPPFPVLFKPWPSPCFSLFPPRTRPTPPHRRRHREARSPCHCRPSGAPRRRRPPHRAHRASHRHTCRQHEDPTPRSFFLPIGPNCAPFLRRDPAAAASVSLDAAPPPASLAPTTLQQGENPTPSLAFMRPEP
jgi:hypothetical protein